MKLTPEKTYDIDTLLADAIKELENKTKPSGLDAKQSAEYELNQVFKNLHCHNTKRSQ